MGSLDDSQVTGRAAVLAVLDAFYTVALRGQENTSK